MMPLFAASNSKFEAVQNPEEIEKIGNCPRCSSRLWVKNLNTNSLHCQICDTIIGISQGWDWSNSKPKDTDMGNTHAEAGHHLTDTDRMVNIKELRKCTVCEKTIEKKSWRSWAEYNKKKFCSSKCGAISKRKLSGCVCKCCTH